MPKNKHLTDQDRLHIEHLLKERVSLKQIAAKLDKSTSTISREVRAHSVVSDKSAPHRIPNRCTRRYDCDKRYLCEDKPNCTRICRSCRLCNNLCPDFLEDVCIKLSAQPYVCNGCADERLCILRRRYYLHHQAHKAYRETLVHSRTGVNLSEDELLLLNEFVSPLILKGQSVHHIIANNPNEFRVSEKSIYRYVNAGLLRAKNIDMPRVCRLKPRKSKPVEHKIDRTCRIGRTYTDYLEFINHSGGIQAVEMDSVIGRIGGKVLLTLMFKSCDLMLAFIRDKNTAQSVIDLFNLMHKTLGVKLFRSPWEYPFLSTISARSILHSAG